MKRIFILSLALVFISAITMAGCAVSEPGASSDPSQSAGNATYGTGATAQASALQASYTFTLDVNPSIEMTVQNGIVTNVVAYNDDGQKILLSAEFTGSYVNDTIKAILNEIASEGFLSVADPYVLIAVNGQEEDRDLNEELQDYAQEALTGLGIDGKVVSASVSQETADGAASFNMSLGRYLIIKYIAREKGITFEEALALYGTASISDLMKMIDDIDEAFDEDGINDIEGNESTEGTDAVSGATPDPSSQTTEGADAVSGATADPDSPTAGSGDADAVSGATTNPGTDEDVEDENDDEDDDEVSESGHSSGHDSEDDDDEHEHEEDDD